MLVVHQIKIRRGKTVVQEHENEINSPDSGAIDTRNVIAVQESFKIVPELCDAFSFAIFP